MATATLQRPTSASLAEQAIKDSSDQDAREEPEAKTKKRPQGFKKLTSQMNVRIETNLKERGDQVFARLGYTPSEIVRALWSYADRHDNNLEEVRTILSRIEEADTEPTTNDRIRSMQEARQAVGDFLQAWGLETSEPKRHEKFDECLDALREEETLSALREMGYAL